MKNCVPQPRVLVSLLQLILLVISVLLVVLLVVVLSSIISSNSSTYHIVTSFSVDGRRAESEDQGFRHNFDIELLKTGTHVDCTRAPHMFMHAIPISLKLGLSLEQTLGCSPRSAHTSPPPQIRTHSLGGSPRASRLEMRRYAMMPSWLTQ